MADVAAALNSQDFDAPVESLMRPGPAESDQTTLEEFPHVHADQPVELALERMGSDQVSMLPVLDRANVSTRAGRRAWGRHFTLVRRPDELAW